MLIEMELQIEAFVFNPLLHKAFRKKSFILLASTFSVVWPASRIRLIETPFFLLPFGCNRNIESTRKLLEVKGGKKKLSARGLAGIGDDRECLINIVVCHAVQQNPELLNDMYKCLSSELGCVYLECTFWQFNTN